MGFYLIFKSIQTFVDNYKCINERIILIFLYLHVNINLKTARDTIMNKSGICKLVKWLFINGKLEAARIVLCG